MYVPLQKTDLIKNYIGETRENLMSRFTVEKLYFSGRKLPPTCVFFHDMLLKISELSLLRISRGFNL